MRLKEFSAQLLIFDNKKLAVIRNIYKVDSSKLKEFFKSYLDSKDFTILISEENSLPPELNFLKKKAFSVEKFENLEGDEWRFFIQKEVRQRKIALAPKAIDFLAEMFEKNSWGLINELEKLSLISKDSPLDVNDLEKIGDYAYQSPNIFSFINAVIGNYEAARRIIALEKLFIGQEEPVKIFNILASLKRLPVKLLQELADYDVMVKSGKMDYEEVLLNLALSG